MKKLSLSPLIIAMSFNCNNHCMEAKKHTKNPLLILRAAHGLYLRSQPSFSMTSFATDNWANDGIKTCNTLLETMTDEDIVKAMKESHQKPQDIVEICTDIEKSMYYNKALRYWVFDILLCCFPGTCSYRQHAIIEETAQLISPLQRLKSVLEKEAQKT